MGRDASRIEVAPFVNVVVSDDMARARNQARLPLAYYVGGMGDYYHASLSRLGFGDEADRVRELWQAGRRKDAMAAINDEMVDSIAICVSSRKVAKRSPASILSRRCRARSFAAPLVRILPTNQSPLTTVEA